MANVSTIDQEIAEQYWRTQTPGSVLALQYDTGWFGSKLAKSIGKAAKGVAKVAIAPVTHVVQAGSAIAHGQNVGKTLVNYVKADLSTVKQVAPYVQTVASFVPGVGTLVSMGIGGVSATLQGKSLTEIGKGIATGAIPGGPIVAAVAMTAANAVAAGVQGQNIAKAVANELVSHAANMIPSPQLQAVLKDATRDALNGKNVLASVKGAAVNQAIAQIPDAMAREAARALVSGKSPAQVITAGGAKLLGQVAAKGAPATASLVQTVQSAAKQVEAAKQVQPMGPSLAPQLRAARPALPFAKSVARTINRATPRTVVTGVVHRPLTTRGRFFIVNRAGRLARDVSGLTADGKWLVQKGDTGSSIAKALTGNANRWTELKAANPAIMKKASAADIAKYGFPMPYAGNVINLPAGWVQAAVVPTPVPAATVPSVQVPSGAPMGQPVPTVVLSNLPTVLAPSGDSAAQAQARVILAVWGKSDGATSAGLSDYGGASELGATSWTARDKLMASSFENWWNKAYKPSAPILGAPGDWNQTLNDALHDWSEHKASQVLPGVTLPTVTPAATATQTPADVPQPTNVIPASGGTPAIQLPGLTITPSVPAQQAQAQTAPAEPTGFAAWWTNNKGAAIPGLIGLATAFGSKYV